MENIMTLEEKVDAFNMLSRGRGGFDWHRWARIIMSHNVYSYGRWYRIGCRWER